MGMIVPTSGLLSAAAIVLLADDGSGTNPVSPSGFTMTGTVSIAGYPARQFRRADGALFVLQRIASGGTPKRWLVVAWMPDTARGPTLAAFAALTTALGVDVIKAWRVIVSANTLTIPSLDSDATAIGTLVKSVWPAYWRTLLSTDPQGTPITGPGTGTAPGPPTGPRIVGNTLA